MHSAGRIAATTKAASAADRIKPQNPSFEKSGTDRSITRRTGESQAVVSGCKTIKPETNAQQRAPSLAAARARG
jgi:hypothetical protein